MSSRWATTIARRAVGVYVEYASHGEFERLKHKAMQRHLDAIPELLDFLWINSRHEIADLGHDKSWDAGSACWFAIMTKGQHEEWCEKRAESLLFSIKCTLHAICAYNKENVKDTKNALTLKSSAKAIRLASDAVTAFFDENFCDDDIINASFDFDAEQRALVPVSMAHILDYSSDCDSDGGSGGGSGGGSNEHQ